MYYINVEGFITVMENLFVLEDIFAKHSRLLCLDYSSSFSFSC